MHPKAFYINLFVIQERVVYHHILKPISIERMDSVSYDQLQKEHNQLLQPFDQLAVSYN